MNYTNLKIPFAKVRLKSKLLLLTLVFGYSILLNGCLSYKQILNFQDGDDLKTGKLDSILNYNPVKIQPDDILQITISSYNREEAEKFNVINSQMLAQLQRTSGGGGVSEPLGYRVDSRGNIEMPVVGIVPVKGLNIEQVRDTISNRVAATGYLQDHSVQIRFLSFRVTILGEVNQPGTFIISNTRITILEAIGLAGDVNIFSNRDNLLVIREQDGKRIYGRLDLKSKNIFNSDYFYLQPNDVVYVEPHKTKVLTAPDPATRYISTILGTATLVTLIITLFR